MCASRVSAASWSLPLLLCDNVRKKEVRRGSSQELGTSNIVLKSDSAVLQKQIECQDALEAAARAEGLPLDSSVHSQLRMLDEEHHKGKYHHGLNALKPIRTTSK